MPVVGSPSDDISDVLAVGRSGVTTIYASLSARHPEGDDADYLEWHTLDHRPEQYRLAAVRASLRVVSTPACRAARAASDERYDAKFTVLAESVKHHIEEEEGELFPKLEGRLDQEELGDKMMARKEQLQQRTGNTSRSRTGNSKIRSARGKGKRSRGKKTRKASGGRR